MSQQGKQIRLDKDAMKKLEEVGRPFESVNDCVKRVLSCSCVKEEMNKLNQEQKEAAEAQAEAAEEEA